MPTIRVSKDGKIANPLAKKLLIVNTNTYEINLEQPELVIDKRSFCIVTLAEHYVRNIQKYECLDNFIKLFSGQNTRIEIETMKGNILGAKVNTYFLNQLKLSIKGLIVLNSVRDGTYIE